MNFDKNFLTERTFNLAVEVIKYLKTLKYSKENDIVRYQLAMVATSTHSVILKTPLFRISSLPSGLEILKQVQNDNKIMSS